MNYYIYKITNKITNKIYIGRRQTEKQIIEDSYMGSGVHLNSSIKKYGIKNFEKEILLICYSFNELCAKEAEIVNVEFISRPDTYNISVGGIFGGTEGQSPTQETRDKISKILKGRKHTVEARNNFSKGQTGKKRSVEARKTMSLINTGSNNPRAIPVQINGIDYLCKKDAMLALSLSYSQLNNLLKSQETRVD